MAKLIPNLTVTYRVRNGLIETVSFPGTSKGSVPLSGASFSVSGGGFLQLGVGDITISGRNTEQLLWKSVPKAHRVRDVLINLATKEREPNSAPADVQPPTPPAPHWFSEGRQCAKYLKHYDDVVAHASQLFSAGSVQTVLDTDTSDRHLAEVILRILLFPIAIWAEIQGKRANPHKRLFKYASDGRNKLMVFREWLVRCTYQEYDHQKEAELFYYIGMPLKYIKTVGINASRLCIWGEGGDWGGMVFHKGDRDAIVALFNELKSEGRLHSEARVSLER